MPMLKPPSSKLSERARLERNAMARARRAGVTCWQLCSAEGSSLPTKVIAELEQYLKAAAAPDCKLTVAISRSHGVDVVKWLDSIGQVRELPFAHAYALMRHPEFSTLGARAEPVLIYLSMAPELMALDFLENLPKSQQSCFSLVLELMALSEFDAPVALLTTKALMYLRRHPLKLKYAYIDESRKAGDLLTFKELNFARGKAAKSNPQLRFSCMPLQVQWGLLTDGLPFVEVPGMSLSSFKMAPFKKIANEYLQFVDAHPSLFFSQHAVHGFLSALYKLVHVLGDEKAIHRLLAARDREEDAFECLLRARSNPAWVDAMSWYYPEEDYVPEVMQKACAYLPDAVFDKDTFFRAIHNLGQFNLPEDPSSWTPSLWAPLVLRHPDALCYVAHFGSLQKQGIMPKSITALKKEVLNLSYPPVDLKWKPLRDLCLKMSLPVYAFQKYLDFWTKASPKPVDLMPAVEISQFSSIGTLKLEKLAPTDIRGPLLGVLTGCCQHLLGAAAQTAKAGVLSPYSCFYVVTKDDDVVAQAWAWMSKQGDVVIDSIESTKHELVPAVASLFRAAAEQILHCGVPAVLLGKTNSGITREVANLLHLGKAAFKRKAVEPFGYFDADAQLLLAGAPAPAQEVIKPKSEYLLRR